MIKKTKVTQELTNVYPPWSKVRSDDQSIGYQALNALAQRVEKMDMQLWDQERNNFLTTANLDEIDLTYRVDLPTSFTFNLNSTDPTNPVPIVPTVSGLVVDTTMSGWVPVTLAQFNDVESLWYTSVPNRAEVGVPVSGVNHILLQGTSNETFPWSGEVTHHLGGGSIWIETDSGVQYITTDSRGNLNRGTVIIRGTTRKDTEESETFIFPWNQKQESRKEWSTIDKIEVYNLEDNVSVKVRSGDFDNEPHLRHYNLKYSDNRNKIDEFFGLSDDGTKLQRIQYVTDEWQQIILGFSDKEVKEEWDLKDVNGNPVTAVDIALQPFSDRGWVVTRSGMLHCFDLDEEMASGVDLLVGRTPNSEVNLETPERRITLGEDLVITPVHSRPLQEITQYRISYQTPSGSKFGLKNGSPVSITSNFWAYPTQINRYLEDDIVITSSEHGEYLFTIEALMTDGSTHVDKVLVMVQLKNALASIDLSDQLTIPGGATLGIDFDSDQRLWVKINTDYFPVSLYTDSMVIDYDNKIIYTKEKYNSLKVDK